MTTQVSVNMAGNPVLIQVLDITDDKPKITQEHIVLQGETPPWLYCTTTRMIQVIDLEQDDPRVVGREKE